MYSPVTSAEARRVFFSQFFRRAPSHKYGPELYPLGLYGTPLRKSLTVSDGRPPYLEAPWALSSPAEAVKSLKAGRGLPKEKLPVVKFRALIIGTGFWGILYYSYHGEPQNPILISSQWSTWKFMGSCKWGYKSPSMGYNYSCLTYSQAI